MSYRGADLRHKGKDRAKERSFIFFHDDIPLSEPSRKRYSISHFIGPSELRGEETQVAGACLGVNFHLKVRAQSIPDRRP